MRRDMITPIQSSFFSCEKDTELILKKLFIDNKKHSETLKRLLLLGVSDCLDETNEKYKSIIDNTSLSEMIEKEYINFTSKVGFAEHEEEKAYIEMSFDGFVDNFTNPEYRDSNIIFNIFCPKSIWRLDNYKLRVLAIVGYIDGLLNGSRLTGIGRLEFQSCSKIAYDENLSGYSLIFRAIHGNDDNIPPRG